MWRTIALLAACTSVPAFAADNPLYVPVGKVTRAPIGWVQYCADTPAACPNNTAPPRDAVLTPKIWDDLVKVNTWVNENVEPLSDADHWGQDEKWSLPMDDYKGDCEDYVLLKRHMLLQAGWPMSALLVTVVRDKHGNGHAVLTVKTNLGEFILDNDERAVLPWHKTAYRFVKRQSQANQNAWVRLRDNRRNILPAKPFDDTQPVGK